MKRSPMKPGAGLKRKKPMNRGNGFKKPEGSPLAKPQKPMASRGKRANRNQPSMDAAYKIAKERSGGVCQWCAQPATEVHHLQTRGAAAHLRENAVNLAHLCSKCHDAHQNDGARFRQKFAAAWPYYRKHYNPALDELKVGRLVKGAFVPLSEIGASAGEGQS